LRTGLSPRELLQVAESSRPTPELDRWMEALRGQVPAGSLRGITEALAASYGRLTAAAQRAARLLACLAAEPIPMSVLQGLDEELVPLEARTALRARSWVTPVEGAEPVEAYGRMHPV